ncbi:MAG: hypothetical protein HC882_00880 [Acidobacteria bacterium]|nr:hypothetical protein [Acidobacteriota bacterium]
MTMDAEEDRVEALASGQIPASAAKTSELMTFIAIAAALGVVLDDKDVEDAVGSVISKDALDKMTAELDLRVPRRGDE